MSSRPVALLLLACTALLSSQIVSVAAAAKKKDMCGYPVSNQQATAELARCSDEDASAAHDNGCPVPYLTGRNLFNYQGQADEDLGEGSFGKVQRKMLCVNACIAEAGRISCTHPRSVAQKYFLPRGNAKSNARQLVGLEREARIMARVTCPSDASLLKHPGRRYVVETYAIINNGSCSEENPMSISMKIYEGGDMKSYFSPDNQKANKYTDCSAKTELALKIAMGLQYIHATGITHRDLHSGNILFDAEGEPAITDFGISMNGTFKLKAFSMDDERYNRARFYVHPPEFARETFAGANVIISDKSDVYALGRIFEQILYDTGTVDNWQTKQWDNHQKPVVVEKINGIILDTMFLPIPARTPCKVFAQHCALQSR
jgi:serine/threonine protein kinase